MIEENESEIDTFTLLDDFIFDTASCDIKLTTARMACECEEARIFKDFNDFIIKVSGPNKIRSKNRKNIYQIDEDKVYFV